MATLQDAFGRRFAYLRLSITDACNFRCTYCLPNGYKRDPEQTAPPLSLQEISHLAVALSELGMWKIRLTGGEPTLRKDLIQIVDTIANIPGVKRVALSTNGHRLKPLILDLERAGLNSMNISVDSLNPTRFQQITGRDELAEILEAIDFILARTSIQIKINAVLMKSLSETEFKDFFTWIKDKNIALRFIELMPTGQNSTLFQKEHFSSATLQEALLRQEWKMTPRDEASGPAIEYQHSAFLGKVGIIAPYSKDFCSTCNRLRVTSTGSLRLCLFGDGNYSFRHLLKTGDQKEELKHFFINTLQKKEVSHYLPEGRFGNNRTFSAMGG